MNKVNLSNLVFPLLHSTTRCRKTAVICTLVSMISSDYFVTNTSLFIFVQLSYTTDR